jgi:hypothetical protein
MSSLIHVLLLGAATMAASEIVRREQKEQKSVSLHLSAGGSLDREYGFDFSMPQAKKMDTKINTCNDDYPLGQLNVNECTEQHFDYPILNREVCVEAAAEAGVTTVHSKFDIAKEWYYKHPRGCFKVPCSEAHSATGHAADTEQDEKDAAETHANGGYCYFFNPVGENPPSAANQLTGVPVCYRPKMINGTIDDSTKAVNCRDGFRTIETLNDCQFAAECLGLCKGHSFDIDSTVNLDYNKYPEGCFIHPADGCVYLNTKPNQVAGQAAWGNPTNPEGTPLCNVTETTLEDTWPTLSTVDHSASIVRSVWRLQQKLA